MGIQSVQLQPVGVRVRPRERGRDREVETHTPDLLGLPLVPARVVAQLAYTSEGAQFPAPGLGRSRTRPIVVSVCGSYPLLNNAMRALVRKLPGVELASEHDTLAEALDCSVGPTDVADAADRADVAAVASAIDLVLLILPQPQDLALLRSLIEPHPVPPSAEDPGRGKRPGVLCVAPTWSADGVLAALQVGARGYLSANLTETELAGALRQAVTGEVTLSPELARNVIAQLAATHQPAVWDPSHLGRAMVHPNSPVLGEQHADGAPQHLLTQREMQIVRMLCEGLGNKEIAQSLFLSLRTVENHLANVYARLGVRSRTEAAVLAIQNGWAAGPR